MVNALLGEVGEMEIDDGFQQLNDGESRMEGGGIPGWWILHDNQSTDDIFCNLSLLRNVTRKADTTSDATQESYALI